jgi:hypothetical protein
MKILLGMMVGFLVFDMIGCATMNYGNMSNLDKGQLETIADETVAYLSSYWLPAKNKIMLVQRHEREPSLFDQLLESRLRKEGYEVMSYVEDRKPASGGNDYAKGFLPLRYVIDNDEPTGLFRIVVYIGNDVIGGVFMQGPDGRMHQSGMWTHKVVAA